MIRILRRSLPHTYPIVCQVKLKQVSPNSRETAEGKTMLCNANEVSNMERFLGGVAAKRQNAIPMMER